MKEFYGTAMSYDTHIFAVFHVCARASTPYTRSAGGAAMLFGLIAYVANLFVKEKASSVDKATTAKSAT
jgi:hypothetical protein